MKSVVAGGAKEDGGGVAVENHVLTEILRDLNYKDSPIILHRIFPSTHVDDLWSLGCMLYHRISIYLSINLSIDPLIDTSIDQSIH